MNVITAAKPFACRQCDQRFGRKYNLRRHVENVHRHATEDNVDLDMEDSQSVDSDVKFEPDSKKCRFEDYDLESSGTVEDEDSEENVSESETDESSDEDESSSDVEDNGTYKGWLKEASDVTEEMWSEKCTKYVDEGMDEDQAKEKANRKTLWAVKQIFFNSYKDFLADYLHLKDNDTHQEIFSDLEEKISKGVNVDRALNRVIAKHQSKFDGLFHQLEEESEN